MSGRDDPGREAGGEQLRDLFQELPRETVEGEPCPEPEELWAAAAGDQRVSAERLGWTVEHTGRCTSCGEDWRIARRLLRKAAAEVGESDEGTAADPDRKIRPISSAGRRRLLSIAAAMTAVVVGAFFWMQLSGPDQTFRQGGRDSIQSLLPEGQPLSRGEPVLRWSGPPGAIYELTVTTGQIAEVASVEHLDRPEYRLPDEALADLPSGTKLYWRVEATVPGRPRLASPTFSFLLE